MARFNGIILRAVGVAAATTLIVVSAAQSCLHGWALGGHSLVHQIIFAGGSVGGAVMGPISFLVAATSFRTWKLGRATVAGILGCLCFAYASTASLGFISSARSDLTAARDRDANNLQLIKIRAQSAATELSTLAKAEPAGRKVEAQRAARRSELERIVAEAQRGLQTVEAVGAPDSQAQALATYAALLGVSLSVETVSQFMLLFMVVFVEAAASTSLVVVAGLARAPAQAEMAAEPAAPDLPAPKLEGAKPGRKRRTDLDTFMDRLKAAPGGKIVGSITSLQSKLGGSSKTATFRALRELEDAGAITREATANGTAIAVA